MQLDRVSRYLKFHEFDPSAAARRIVDYWSTRVELFGPRAFLPLLLTGEGALSEEDLEVFRTGSFMLLPRNTDQTHVLLYDPARLTTTVVTDTARRLRCLFYFLSAISESDSSVVFLHLFNSRTRKATFDPNFLSESVSYLARQIIPVRVVEAHMVMIATGLGNVIPLTIREMESMGQHKPDKIVVYEQKSLEEIQSEMKTHGFTLEGLPRVPFEGLFSFGCFRRWIDERIRLGSQVYVSKSAPVEDPQEIEVRKRRQIEAANARRKRARKKIEVSVLQSEVDRLMQQRDALQKTERELNTKIDNARLIVRVYTSQVHHERDASGLSLSDHSRQMVLGASEFPPSLFPEGRLATSREPVTPAAGTDSNQTPPSGPSHQSQATQASLSDLLFRSQLGSIHPSSLALLPLLQSNPVNAAAVAVALFLASKSQQPEQRAPQPQIAPARAPVSANSPPMNPQPPAQQPSVDAAAAAAAAVSQLALLQELFTMLNGTRQS
jgi:hypothetical protein